MIKPALPEAFVSRMKGILDGELADFLRALEEPPYRGIRMNLLKRTHATGCYEQGETVPWAEGAWILPHDSEAGSTILHEAGAFYLQEPGAMIPSAVLNAKPGETVLDLCAAPGGKTTQTGIAMRNTGLLVANEPVLKRARILSRNVERMGLTHTVVTCAWPEQLAARWQDAFDAVLVDAPCSGEGMFRRVPESRTEWTAEKAEGCAGRQRGILECAAKTVRPGGRLVYSTCTYNPEENEDNVNWFLSRFPDFETVSFALPGISAPDGMFTCYPHRMKGEGQFTALLYRKGTGTAGFPAKASLPGVTGEEIRAFQKELPGLPQPNIRLGPVYARLDSCPDLSGIRVLRAGLHLGELHGKTIVPDHAAAVAAERPVIPAVELGPEETVSYLAGETLNRGVNGWILLRYHELVLGWGKGSDGIIRNHYPKGLRGGHFLP